MDIFSKLSLSVALFSLTVAFRFSLSHLGNLYNGILLIFTSYSPWLPSFLLSDSFRIPLKR